MVLFRRVYGRPLRSRATSTHAAEWWTLGLGLDSDMICPPGPFLSPKGWKESRSLGRRLLRLLLRLTRTILSWPHERFFSSVVFATALYQRGKTGAEKLWRGSKYFYLHARGVAPVHPLGLLRRVACHFGLILEVQPPARRLRQNITATVFLGGVVEAEFGPGRRHVVGPRGATLAPPKAHRNCGRVTVEGCRGYDIVRTHIDEQDGVLWRPCQ